MIYRLVCSKHNNEVFDRRNMKSSSTHTQKIMFAGIFAEKMVEFLHFLHTICIKPGITLEGHVSDVIALDQTTSLFSPQESDKNVALIFRKVRNLSFPIYTCVISSSLTSGDVQHAFRLVYIKTKSIRGRRPV